MSIFFFFDNNDLPNIEIIKNCLAKIASLGNKLGTPLYEINDSLAKEMETLAYTMFCYHKQYIKTFTVCNNSKLRGIRIAEDDDGLTFEDNINVIKILSGNIEAFVELVVQSYVLPKPKKSPISEKLFYVCVHSQYSGKRHDVFFSNYKGKLFVFSDSLTDIDLVDYIKDYFSLSDFPVITNLASDLLSDESSFIDMQKSVYNIFEDYNNSVRYEYGFTPGAITFLDFLAWKGLWQSQGGNVILTKISELIIEFREKLNNLSDSLYMHAYGIQLSQLISISDTIAIFSPKVSIINECQLLELHALLSQYILQRCSEEMLPIRGAITYGEYSILNNIMLGSGIDECASWHETGNWIGVHFTPSAQIYWDDSINSETVVISPSEIPLKNGLTAKYCVKWHITKKTFKLLSLHSKALLPEIASKYTNTYEFLKKYDWEVENHGSK